MGEPEAGSEFAKRAAAAGEVRRPGFGDTVCHPQGTRARLDRTKDHSLFTHPLVRFPNPSRLRRPRSVLGSQELTPVSEPGEIALLGRSIGSVGKLETHSQLGVRAWRIPWFGRPPGSQPGCEIFGKLLALAESQFL
jgi:hypothetical protein